MTRVALLAAALLLCSTCGGANKQEMDKMHLQLLALQVEKRDLQQQLAAKPNQPPPAGSQLDRHARPPLHGFIDSREEFCSGAMCLEVRNGEDFPVSELLVDGRKVKLHSEQGPFLWPGQSAYVRVREPGTHHIAVKLVDAVQAPMGPIPRPDVIVKTCRVQRRVPLAMDARAGKALVYIGSGACRLAQ